MANVLFKQGTRAEYDALAVKDSNTLYWLSDTLELLKGDQLYAKGTEATGLASGLMSAADKAKLDAISDGGVRLSKVDGNALEMKEDGLYVAAVVSGGGAEFSIEKQETPESNAYATYKLKRTEGDEAAYVGDPINIPKDAVLSGGTFEIVETAGVPYEGAAVGDPYVDLIVDDADSTHIYIPMKGLVDTVKAGEGIEVTDNTVFIKLNKVEAHGLLIDENGLKLALATTTSAGAMSAEDKISLDSVMASIVWGNLSDEQPA